MKSVHQPKRRHFRGPPSRVRIHSTPRGSTAETAVALTPPQQATASADSAAARLTEPSREPRTRGISTHGASAVGHSSTEVAPSSDVIRGASTNTKAPVAWAHGAPMRSSRHSLTTPKNASHRSRTHHSRCTIHSGTWAALPSTKNGPIGHR